MIAATDDPDVDGPVYRDAEAPGIWVNSADDPAHCRVHPAVPACGGDPSLVTVSTGGRSPALATWLRRRIDGGARPRVRGAARDRSPRSGTPSAPRGVPPRALIGSGPRFGDAGPDPRGRTRRSQGAPRRRVCRRHRTEPPHHAARAARADDDRRRAACPRRCTTLGVPRARQRGRRALDVQPHRGLRRRRAVPRRLRTTSATSSPSWPSSPPEDFADHLYVHYDREADPPPVLGRRRARLRGGRREPRSSARSAAGLGAGPGRGRRRPGPQPAVPPRPRGRQAGPHRDRHRPGHRVGVARRGRDGRRAARLARRPPGARARRRRHGRGHGRRAGQRRRRRRSSSPTAPGERAAALADRVGGQAVRLSDLPTALAEVDVLLTSTGATVDRCSSTPTSRRSSRPRDGRPLLIVDIAVPRDVDPSVADLARRHAARHGRPAPLRRRPASQRAPARGRRGRARSSTTRSTASSRPRSGPRGRAAGRRAARPGRGRPPGRARALPRPARRRSTTAQRAAVEALTKGLVAKLLHEPTVRLKDAAGTPKGERLAEALRDLFDLDVAPSVRIRAATRGSRAGPLAGRRTSPTSLRRADPRPRGRSWSWSRPRATGASTSRSAEIGGKGVFAKEVQAAVLDGRADLAVHSAKDLPVGHPRRPGARGGARAGRRPRRAGRLDARRPARRARPWPPARGAGGSSWPTPGPTSRFAELRGNMRTRLAKAAEFDAIVVAAVALRAARPGATTSPRCSSPVDDGAAGRRRARSPSSAGPTTTRPRALLAAIEHGPSRRRVDAERAFLAELGGDCDLPAGAHATIVERDELRLVAVLAGDDGTVHRGASRAATRRSSVLRSPRSSAGTPASDRAPQAGREVVAADGCRNDRAGGRSCPG